MNIPPETHVQSATVAVPVELAENTNDIDGRGEDFAEEDGQQQLHEFTTCINFSTVIADTVIFTLLIMGSLTVGYYSSLRSITDAALGFVTFPILSCCGCCGQMCHQQTLPVWIAILLILGNLIKVVLLVVLLIDLEQRRFVHWLWYSAFIFCKCLCNCS